MLGSSIQIGSPNTLSSSAAKDVLDDILFTIGTDGDIVALNRSTVLDANTALASVLIGTPVAQALAANSLIISNVTASGDIAMYTNTGDNSQQFLFMDGSANSLYLGASGYFFLSSAGLLCLNDNANTGMTLGITVNQGANDNEAYAAKSSDVAHGITGFAETDTYFLVQKALADTGGAAIKGLKESGDSYAIALQLTGLCANTADTTKSTAGQAIVQALGYQTSGTGIANIAANSNVFGVGTYIGSAYVSMALFDSDGDLWLNGGLTTTTASTLNGATSMAVAADGNILDLKYSAVSTGTIKVAKVTKAYNSDLFNAADVTDSAVVWAQPANSIVLGCRMKMTAQFDDQPANAMSDLDVEVGLDADHNGLTAPAAMNLTSATVNDEFSGPGAYVNTATAVSIAGQNWTAYSTAVGANLSTLSAGSLDFYFIYLQL